MRESVPNDLTFVVPFIDFSFQHSCCCHILVLISYFFFFWLSQATMKVSLVPSLHHHPKGYTAPSSRLEEAPFVQQNIAETLLYASVDLKASLCATATRELGSGT